MRVRTHTPLRLVSFGCRKRVPLKGSGELFDAELLHGSWVLHTIANKVEGQDGFLYKGARTAHRALGGKSYLNVPRHASQSRFHAATHPGVHELPIDASGHGIDPWNFPENLSTFRDRKQANSMRGLISF